MAASTKTPWEIVDFSGGITDSIWSGAMNVHNQLDNFDITPDKKLLSRMGSTLDDATHSPLPSGNTRIGLIVNYGRNTKLFVQSGVNFYYRAATPGVYTLLAGPSSNPVLNAGNTSNFVSTSEWNRQLFVVSDAFPATMKIYQDGSSNFQVRNAGLPLMASNPTVTAGAVGTNSYVYAFVLSYTYTVGSKTFQDLGPIIEVVLPSAAAPNVNAVSITAIPVLTNTGGNNYDTSNIKVQVYRTINNGTNFYFVGQVTNGTTTFSDSVSDTTLQNNLQLYTNDGTLDFYPPPAAKFVRVVGNIAFYGYTQDSTGTHPYRVHQSVPGNPNFCPQTTWNEGEDVVAGLGAIKSLALVLCQKVIYRIDGVYDSFGRNGMNFTKIHDTAGCISHASVVEAENYCYWAGIDGFYASDGYQVFKISDHLNTRYQNMLTAMGANLSRIQGKYDEINRKVYWSVQQTSSNPDNDSCFVLDLRWGSSNMMSFTTYSGTSFAPTCLEVFNNQLYRADYRGFVFIHSQTVFTDPQVNTSVSSSLWNQETIIWNYLSCQWNFGSTFFRKFVPRILLQAANAGNTTIQLNAVNDQGRTTRALKLIRWRSNFIWGDPTVTWGNPACVWNAEGLIEQWRRFPAGGLRLSYLQMQITNGFGIVTASGNDPSSVLTLNRSAKTLTFAGGFPSQSVGYFVALSSDNYVTQYQVSAQSVDLTILTVLDPLNKLPASGTYTWELSGLQKGEQLNLLAYNLYWENVDQNQGTFQAGDDGTN